MWVKGQNSRIIWKNSCHFNVFFFNPIIHNIKRDFFTANREVGVISFCCKTLVSCGWVWNAFCLGVGMRSCTHSHRGLQFLMTGIRCREFPLVSSSVPAPTSCLHYPEQLGCLRNKHTWKKLISSRSSHTGRPSHHPPARWPLVRSELTARSLTVGAGRKNGVRVGGSRPTLEARGAVFRRRDEERTRAWRLAIKRIGWNDNDIEPA